MNPMEMPVELDRWAHSKGLNLLRDNRQRPRWFYYLSNEFGWTIQVVIEAAYDNEERIDCHLIESDTDEVAHFTWISSRTRFTDILEVSHATAEEWLRRTASGR